MKNIELLFLKNNINNNVKIKLTGNIIYVKILPPEELFTGIQIKQIIHTVNAIHKKYGKLKVTIVFQFGRIKFIDKLTYVFLECICYYLIEHYGHPVQIFMEIQNDIHIAGINSSPLLLLNNTKTSSIEKFPKCYNFDIYGYHFRRVIKCTEQNSNFLGELYEEIDRFLKPFSIDEECRDQVGLVITELVGNACEHAETDCLLDIDVTPDFEKHQGEVTDENYYYGINIAVINFSEKLLGDDIKNNILLNEDLIPRYKDVLKAYGNHKKVFGEEYVEDDFCNITAFQSKISGRKEKFTTGGTGLPVLIKSLEDKSDTYRCYVVSGDRCINFYQEFLEYDSDGWIGFNEQNCYLENVPQSYSGSVVKTKI